MSEYQIETRQRSRSKTPFLRSSCDHENCEHAGEEGHVHHHQKKTVAVSPNVRTIIEETVEVTKSSSAKVTQSDRFRKMHTSDYSSEDNTPRKGDSAATHNYTSMSSSILRNIVGKRAQTSTPISSSTPSDEGVSKRTKSSRLFAFGSSNLSSPNQTDRDDLSDHLAYLEYKRAGEYWKKFPKTDYTYSEFSRCRRLLAPGIVAMPNMSRRSLENFDERVDYMVNRDPAREESIRRRFASQKFTGTRSAMQKLAYDSGEDELDTVYRRQSYYNGRSLYETEQSWLVRVVTSIVSIFSSVLTTITGGDTQAYDSSALYQTQYVQEKRGFLGSITHSISSALLGLSRYIYLAISSILCLDSWLLRSSSPENRNKKRFLLFLLMLLPFLLLAGLFYYLHPNEPFPPKSFSKVTFTLPEIPDLPKIDISEYVNEEKYEALKAQAFNRYVGFRDWTDDYLLYLKTLSQNVYDEGRKLFRNEEHFERV